MVDFNYPRGIRGWGFTGVALLAFTVFGSAQAFRAFLYTPARAKLSELKNPIQGGCERLIVSRVNENGRVVTANVQDYGLCLAIVSKGAEGPEARVIGRVRKSGILYARDHNTARGMFLDTAGQRRFYDYEQVDPTSEQNIRVGILESLRRSDENLG